MGERYDAASAREMYADGCASSEARACVVVVPGLGDGPASLSYVARGSALEARCASTARALIRFELSTSYEGYGTRQLRDDARDIDAVIRALRVKFPLATSFALVGHSTGCQSICHYLASGYDSASAVDRIVLQAGVSDRDWYDADCGREVMREWVARAREMAPDDLMPADTPGTYGVATNARRFLSLASAGGDDDWFSLDIFDGSSGEGVESSKIVRKLGAGACARVDVRLVVSTADEYVPYDRDVVVAHNERNRNAFARVAKSARTHYIEANHDLSDMAEKDAPGFVDFVLS